MEHALPRHQIDLIHIAVLQIRFSSERFQFRIVGAGRVHARQPGVEQRDRVDLNDISNLSHDLRSRRLLRIHQ